MFACHNFLQKSSRKFHKEQKLFYGHLIKNDHIKLKSGPQGRFGAISNT